MNDSRQSAYNARYHREHRTEISRRKASEYAGRKDEIQKRNRVVKAETLAYYGKGGLLQCCWPDCVVADVDMLTIDHIANDGAKRRKSGEHGGMALYAKLRRGGFPLGYQTLCHNHQWKKELIRRRQQCGNS